MTAIDMSDDATRHFMTLVFLRGHARLQAIGMKSSRGVSVIKAARRLGYDGPKKNKAVLDWVVAEIERLRPQVQQ